MRVKKNIGFLAFVFFFLAGAFLTVPATLAETVPTRSETVATISENNQALNLSDCYQLALKQSETIGINAQLIKEAEAHFLQALGTALPQVSFSWSQTNQDSGRAFSTFSNNHSLQSNFVFTQTLFSGFKEFAGMAGSHLEHDQRLKEKKRAEQLLFVDVADAFYLLLETQEDLKTLETTQKALQDRIVELKKREDVGRSRPSEVVSTEAQLYSLEADIETSRTQERVSRDLLEFLTGKPIAGLSDENEMPSALAEEKEFLAKLDSRPDVQASQSAWGVQKKAVTVARSGLFPTVSLEGDYYTHRDSDPTDLTWATFLTVDVPIFSGTITYGNIKAANAQAREGELQFQQTRRLALQDIKDSYVRATSAIVQCDLNQKALTSAELNFKLQSEDYLRNLVNNLDVLSAIQTLEVTRRSYNHSFYEKKRLYWQLQAAVGETPEGTVK